MNEPTLLFGSNRTGAHWRHSKQSVGDLPSRMASLLERPAYFTLAWIAMATLYLLRIVHLDADLPPWGVVAYQPIDEGFYGIMALNVQNYGTIDPNAFFGENIFLMNAQDINGAFTNLFVLAGLTLFGDNYFGLRMGSVFAGLLVLALMYATASQLFSKHGTLRPYRRLAGFAAAAILLTSFPFYNASRIVEPSLFRMLFSLLVAYLFISDSLDLRVRSALIGFCTIFSIFLVYVTNIFLGIPILGYLCLLLIRRKWKAAWTYLLFGMLGSCLAYALALLYYETLWGISPIANLVTCISIFSGSVIANQGDSSLHLGVSPYVTSSLLGILRNARDFLTANPILYSFPLISIAALTSRDKKDRRYQALIDDRLIFLLFITGMLAQTLFASDFIVRKQIIILPMMVLLGFTAIPSISLDINRGRRRFFPTVIFSSLAICWMLYLVVFRLFRARNSVVTTLDFTRGDRLLFAVVLTGTLVVLLYTVHALAKRKKIRSYIVFGAFAGFYLILNLSMIARYNCLDQTYQDRNTMTEIGKLANNEVVAGDYFVGFTLYNDALPLKNDRNALQSYLAEHPGTYFFDYINANSFTLRPMDTWQNLTVLKEYPRAYQNFAAGSNRHVALYLCTLDGTENQNE